MNRYTEGVFKVNDFSEEGYLSLRYRSPCEGWLYHPPLPTRSQASSVVSFVRSDSMAALAVQGPRRVPDSTAASSSARTRGSWLSGYKWQCKDLLCTWLHGCK